MTLPGKEVKGGCGEHGRKSDRFGRIGPIQVTGEGTARTGTSEVPRPGALTNATHRIAA